MPDKYDPDEKFKPDEDIEPEEALRRLVNAKSCPRCGSVLVAESDENPDGSRRGTGVLLCPNCDYASDED